ncbi:hypothetical protein DVH05_026705 [Phytophthora capsici]|nr:hypothetical protein DVH05_026705 [Phytophthora capsici]
MVLISLRCVIVGNVGSSFEVKIDDDVTVGKLQDVVKSKSEDLKCPSSCLQLFLAKTDNWRWLDEASAAAVESDDLRHVTPMDSTLYVRNPKYFGSNFQPDKGQVHVLVLVPKINLKRPAGEEAIDNAILKRVKTMALDLSDIKTVLANPRY